MDIGVDYINLFEYDASTLKPYLSLDSSTWKFNSKIRERIPVHVNTKSLVYVWADETNLRKREVYISPDQKGTLHSIVWDIAEKIRLYYSNEAVITLLALALLLPNKNIIEHVDSPILQTIHRCHLPIITHPNCMFNIGEGTYNFPENMVFEFNNARRHSVYNDNPDIPRVHLLCDILSV